MLLLNLVDLGTSTGQTNTTILSSPEEFRRSRFTNTAFATNFPPFNATNFPNAASRATANFPPGPVHRRPSVHGHEDSHAGTPTFVCRDQWGPGRVPPGRPGTTASNPNLRSERPFWMSQEDYNDLIQMRGLHAFVVVMSTKSMITTVQKDFWLRIFIASLVSLSVAGYALAWGNLKKTSELQIRLVRASELNSHLKELNIAAAGLAHETRNPLNIVRGLAQMISRRDDAPPEIRARSREIVDETDRITGQLNEFINYSRPREVRRAAVA